jgi:hypothetical protein
VSKNNLDYSTISSIKRAASRQSLSKPITILIGHKNEPNVGSSQPKLCQKANQNYIHVSTIGSQRIQEHIPNGDISYFSSINENHGHNQSNFIPCDMSALSSVQNQHQLSLNM